MNLVEALPAFPEFRELSLKDREFMNTLLREEQPQISELTFGNLFMWHESEPVQLSRIGNTVLARYGKQVDGSSILLPPLRKRSLTEVLETMKQAAGSNYTLPSLYGISSREAEELAALKAHVEPCRDEWDYVYLTKDLADLPGDKYHAKRNLITQCLSKHKCEYSDITTPVINQCLQLQAKWCNLRSCNEVPSLAAENQAIKRLFEHYQELDVFGGAVYVNGMLEAFTVAEQLNNTTAVIHVEKANPSVKGLYQLINQWFCQKALAGFEFVNREQDLGMPGLRKAKKSYHPHHMIEKYKAYLT